MLTTECEVGARQSAGLDHVESSKVESLGSLPLKQERSGGSDEEALRPTKIFKPNEFDVFAKNDLPEAAGSFLLRSGSMVSGGDGQTMLCFSSTTSEAQSQAGEASFPCTVSRDASSRNEDSPLFEAQQTPFYAKSSISAACHEGAYWPLSRFREPFTPLQWMELEHQALIYKHLVATVPVPSNLLIPLKQCLNPYALSSLASGSHFSNSGFSSNTDPEPGRCRRTDGKKWRCSRDAVPDQKYCERHINRGRHRSRKPVEGQTGHAVTGFTTSKVAPISSLVMSSGGASNNLGAMEHQLKNSQPSNVNPSTDHLTTRVQDLHGLSIVSPTIKLKPNNYPLSVGKLNETFDESTQPEFGIVSSDSLLNPSESSSFVNSRNVDSVTSFNDQETYNQHPFRHFIDKWPKDESDRGSVTWPGELKSDWTQLSMSFPMTSSGFSSSSNSPQQRKLTLSPLRLAGEFDPIQMGLSVSNEPNGPTQKQTHRLPVCWGNSVGGPLGEVLNNTANASGGSKSSSALNLVTQRWDSSAQFESSPTGVLQKSTFTSLSNSSAGSSPRCDNNKAPEAVSFCLDMLGSSSRVHHLL